MRIFFALALSAWLALPAFANDKALKALGVQASDATGCYLSDGKEVIGPTIGLMVAVYKEPDTKISSDAVKKIMLAAIKSGCNIHERDQAGFSPLNAAILFNHPDLVKLLLSKGANPDYKIISGKPRLHGLDSFGFIEYLLSRKQDRPEIRKILAEYSARKG